MEYCNGEIAFSSLTKHDTFQGESTGKFSVTVTVDDDTAQRLEGQGIKLKTHDGKKQRAFKTQYEFAYVDTNKKPVEGELGRGSKVKIAYKLGGNYGEYGVTTFLQGVQVIERVEPAGTTDVFEVDASAVPDDGMPF
jgi:hypothetical protein